MKDIKTFTDSLQREKIVEHLRSSCLQLDRWADDRDARVHDIGVLEKVWHFYRLAFLEYCIMHEIDPYELEKEEEVKAALQGLMVMYTKSLYPRWEIDDIANTQCGP